MCSLSRKNRLILIGIVLFFALLYSIISLGKHFQFLTSAWDVGIFDQVLFQYSHLDFGVNTVRRVPSLLGDHFELLLFFIAPFHYLFGSYTLLVFQLLAVLFGGVGMFYYLRRITKGDDVLSFSGLVLFFGFWSVLQALYFDVHNNVIGAMFLPWILLMCANKSWRWFYVLLALCLISKETLALVGLFLGLGMAIFGKDEERKHGLITMLISFVYFVLVLKVFIPFFNHEEYSHWVYDAIGPTPLSALWYVISHPVETLFIAFNDPEKVRFWKYLFLSGGLLIFFYPRLLLIALPVIGAKVLSYESAHWGVWYHYAIELAPLIVIAVISSAYALRGKKRYVLLGIFLVVNFVMSVKMLSPTGHTLLGEIKEKFVVNERRIVFEKALAFIPVDASVSTQNTLVPHLSSRKQIYLLPDVSGAEYVITADREVNIWPYKSVDAIREQRENLLKKGIYEEIYSEDEVKVLKRK